MESETENLPATVNPAVAASPETTEPDAPWAAVVDLLCNLSVDLAIPGITVGDLLALEIGSVIDSRIPEGSPLPIWVNELVVGWAEFDVVGKHLAVRVAELR